MKTIVSNIVVLALALLCLGLGVKQVANHGIRSVTVGACKPWNPFWP